MMSKAELEAYRREHPEAAARADADRERVSALLVELLVYEGTDLDQVPDADRERVAALVRELVAEKCVDTDDVAWQVTARGRALLAWRSETRPT